MSQANDGKALETSVDGKSYARIPLRTRVVMPQDDLDAIITEYAKDAVQPGDLLFVTEKIVAITQGRSYRLDEIKPRKLALFLSKYVTRTPYGIGLGMPETMEMALRECGTPRILFASAVAAVTKAFGRLGDRNTGGGVGLGLSVAQGFVQAMDGTIEAVDTPGGGLTMVIGLHTGPPGQVRS